MNSSQDSMIHWTIQDYLYVTAECVTGVLSVLGNSLVLVAIAKTRGLQTITNCFIGSLAAADVLVGLVLPPIVILPYRGWPKDFYGCVLMNTVVLLITNISILSMLTVALERYMAISDPFRYHRVMSVRRALMVVALTWVVAILIGLVPTMGWNLGQEGFEECSFTNVIPMEYMVYLGFFGVTLLPLTFMLVIYCYIFHIVRKQRRAVAEVTVFSLHRQHKLQRKQKREVRGAKGLAYVIILFAVCWLPIQIMNCVTLFAPDHKASLQWHLVAIVLSHANSVVNPFLYAFSNSQFKAAMTKLLLCGRCQRFFSVDTIDIESGYSKPTSRCIDEKKDTHNWSPLDVMDILSSSSTQFKASAFAEPSVWFSRSSGVLNEGFFAEEARDSKQEGEAADPNQACRNGGSSQQSETVMETAVYETCRHVSWMDCHLEANSVPVASAGDGTATPVQHGHSSTHLWATQSSNPSHPPQCQLSPRGLAPSSPSQPSLGSGEEQTLGQASPTDPCSSSSGRSDDQALDTRLVDGEKGNRNDNSSASRCFVSIRL